MEEDSTNNSGSDRLEEILICPQSEQSFESFSPEATVPSEQLDASFTGRAAVEDAPLGLFSQAMGEFPLKLHSGRAQDYQPAETTPQTAAHDVLNSLDAFAKLAFARMKLSTVDEAGMK